MKEFEMKVNSYKIFVDNLPSGVTLKDLQDAFKHIGKVLTAEIFSNPVNERNSNKKDKSTTSYIYKYIKMYNIKYSHAFLYFENTKEKEKSLSPVLKIFGIPIKGNLCRTSNVEDHRTLYIGNLNYGMTSNDIMSSLNHLLSSSLKVYLVLLLYCLLDSFRRP